jgi:hypothetical protein
MRVVIHVGEDETARQAKETARSIRSQVLNYLRGHHDIEIHYASEYGEAGHL